MSCNRENTCWKSRDGNWYLGFYDFHYTGDSSDPDFDYEWDVDYDFSRFNWVSGPHTTRKAANDSWDGSNPGGGEVIETPSERTDILDKMRLAYSAEIKERNRIARERQALFRR